MSEQGSDERDYPDPLRVGGFFANLNAPDPNEALLHELVFNNAVQNAMNYEGIKPDRARIYGIDVDGIDLVLRLSPPPSHDDPGVAPGRTATLDLGTYDDADQNGHHQRVFIDGRLFAVDEGSFACENYGSVDTGRTIDGVSTDPFESRYMTFVPDDGADVEAPHGTLHVGDGAFEAQVTSIREIQGELPSMQSDEQ